MIDNSNSKDSSPLVTVYMPTYNRVELLQRAVDSVLQQDYKNIELIVVDDNSTDGTHEYLAKMAKEDSRFRYFVNERNSGACVSRNKAIFSANGEFITGIDDDDYLLKYHISSLIKNWNNKKKEVIAVFPNSYIKSINGIKKMPKRSSTCSYYELLSANWIGNQLFTRTNYLQEIGGFSETMPAWQDLECWFRLLKHYNAKASSAKKYSYVTDVSHPHERISTGKINSIIFAYEKFCHDNNLTSTERKVLRLQVNPYTREKVLLSSVALSLLYVPKKHNIKRSIFLLITPIAKTLRDFKLNYKIKLKKKN